MVVGENQKILEHVSLMVKNIDLDTKINILSYLGEKIVPLSGPGPCCCHCCWCWCTLGSSETCSNQLPKKFQPSKLKTVEVTGILAKRHRQTIRQTPKVSYRAAFAAKNG